MKGVHEMKITDSRHRLKELLSITGDSQNEMARKSGLTKSAISNYINGSREPRQDALLLLSKAYDVSPAWLMGLDVPMDNEKSVDSHIASFFDGLMENSNHNEKDIQEIRKILEKAEDSKNSEASKFYNLFLNAPAHIQVAVESLLKGSQHES